MSDLILNYRACGAECCEDWLRMLASENGLPFGTVQRLAEELGDGKDFGELVETLDAFTPDNDPYGERDFGAIDQVGDGRWMTTRPARAVETVFWNIDAYDRDLRFGSEDPEIPAVTRRVLTIMLANEYCGRWSMAKRKPAICIAGPDPDQTTMPGVRSDKLGEKLRCRADMPMLPRRNQKPLDIGFWDPMRDQLDLF